MEDRGRKAVVQKVVLDGKHGPYAVATIEGFVRSVTFSLGEDTWPHHDLPTQGMIVVLSDLREKRGGWRALSARFSKPTDESPATSKEQAQDGQDNEQ